MSLLLKHYSLNRHETVRGWKDHQHAHPCLKIRVGGKLPMIEEDESEPKCAVMKISLVAGKESKWLVQPHTSCLGGWQKINRNHGWLIWVSYSQQHYSAVGSAWISLRLALCPANIQFTGNELLLPLLKIRLWVFRPGCSFFFMWEAQAIILVAPENKASCFGRQRKCWGAGEQ